MSRTRRVYRLHVTYPPRSHWTQPDHDPEWTPESWLKERRRLLDEIREWREHGNGDPFSNPGPLPAEYEEWRGWPRPRLDYLTRSGAEARADLLRSLGATVTIEASNPVTWGAVTLPAPGEDAVTA